MKLEVGIYVRTDKGYIGKLDIEKETIAVANWTGDYELEEITQYYVNNNRYNKFEIIKASHSIIDLIQVGDYINGAKVVRFKTDENGVKWIYTNNENAYGYKSDEIKSIVTKEMYSSVEYKVGDE